MSQVPTRVQVALPLNMVHNGREVVSALWSGIIDFKGKDPVAVYLSLIHPRGSTPPATIFLRGQEEIPGEVPQPPRWFFTVVAWMNHHHDYQLFMEMVQGRAPMPGHLTTKEALVLAYESKDSADALEAVLENMGAPS